MSNKGKGKGEDSLGKGKTSGEQDQPSGILKDPSKEDQKQKKTTPRKSIRWDEMNVRATLHPAGKDYGHIKITEVPTPYERPTPEDGAGVDAAELARRLEETVRRETLMSASSEDFSTVDADDEDSQGEEARRRKFRDKRKEHYKEFTIAKMRAMAESDDEDNNGTSGQQSKK